MNEANSSPKGQPVLYTWGANSYGQLGTGDTEDMLSPKLVSNLPFCPRCIIGGGGHTFFVTDDKLYSCGWNKKGQLGLAEADSDDALTPHLVTFFNHKPLKSLSAGWDHSLGCTEDGDLYVWGSNAFGQLGIPDIKGYTSIPTLLTLPERVSAVAAGLRHSLALTVSGKVYAWGSGKKGQLGITEQDKCPTVLHTPTQVTFPEEAGIIAQVVCGAYHSAALSASGSIWTWGDNKHGQMALPSTEGKSVLRPRQIAPLGTAFPVTALRSGWTHMLALTSDNELYSWGRNDYGQLGRSSQDNCDPGAASSAVTSNSDPKPALIPTIHHLRQLVCGSEHNVGLTDEGDVITFGWNEHGICGTGDEVNVPSPHQVSLLKHVRVEMVGSGNGHTFAYGFVR